MARESHIERTSCGLMGPWLVIKIGWEGFPDRLVIWAAGRHFWIEFKQPGGTLTKAQERRIPKLRARGEVVFIIDSVDEVRALLEVLR
jgi:hypothetical protein